MPSSLLLDYSIGPGGIDEVLKEMAIAEDNFAQIQQAANRFKEGVLRLERQLARNAEGGSGAFDMTTLDQLVHGLRTAYACIRRKVKDENPGVDVGSGMVAKSSRSFQPETVRFLCLCPLTIFLQEIARALNSLWIKINAGEPDQKTWGKIHPLYQHLNKLSKSLLRVELQGPGTKIRFFPGIAQCLMFHEENSSFIVTSSAARYERLVGLQQYARQVRGEYILSMRGRCSPSIQERINEVERGSQALWNQFNEDVPTGDPKRQDWENPFAGPRGVQPVKLGGQSATFDPEGKYKNACLIDFCRFVMERPLKAAAYENKRIRSDRNRPVPGRPPFPEGSCAEWEMWVTVLSSPEPIPREALPRPVPRREGQPRSNTHPLQSPSEGSQRRPSLPQDHQYRQFNSARSTVQKSSNPRGSDQRPKREQVGPNDRAGNQKKTSWWCCG